VISIVQTRDIHILDVVALIAVSEAHSAMPYLARKECMAVSMHQWLRRSETSSADVVCWGCVRARRTRSLRHVETEGGQWTGLVITWLRLDLFGTSGSHPLPHLHF
jgi:hypothetical protein